jgi:hypothetical protein
MIMIMFQSFFPQIIFRALARADFPQIIFRALARAGIHFPHTPFSARPARLVRQSFNGGGALWDFAKRLRRFAQKRFAHFQL